jgi:hypothetical protein
MAAKRLAGDLNFVPGARFMRLANGLQHRMTLPGGA